MKKADLIKWLDSQGFKSKAFNSNNSWGFGGARGTHYAHPDGHQLKFGIATQRRGPEWNFVTLTLGDDRHRVIDANSEQKVYAGVKLEIENWNKENGR